MAETGRPTKYSEEILVKAQEYLDSCEDIDRQIVKQTNSEKGYEMYENKLVVKLPSIEGLARFLNISRSTIYKWAEEKKEFSDILEDLLVKQAERLLNNGLSGDYNSTIAKLILTKHGYVEKTATEHSGKIESGLSPEDQAKMDKLLLKKNTMPEEETPVAPEATPEVPQEETPVESTPVETPSETPTEETPQA